MQVPRDRNGQFQQHTLPDYILKGEENKVNIEPILNANQLYMKDKEQPLVHIRLQQAARHSDGEVDLYDLPAMEADTEGLVFSGEAPAGSPEDIGMSEFSLCGT